MARKRYTPEQIIGKLREAEVDLASGQTVLEVCRALGITEQTYYRWRKEYSGLKVEQARRFKELERHRDLVARHHPSFLESYREDIVAHEEEGRLFCHSVGRAWFKLVRARSSGRGI